MRIIINDQKFDVSVADSFIKRFCGLMFKNKITRGVFFPKTKSIHTFFMKDMIDVIMIDKKNLVVYYQKNVKKNKIIIKKEAYHTIELPNNSINNIKINDKLIITD